MQIIYFFLDLEDFSLGLAGIWCTLVKVFLGLNLTVFFFLLFDREGFRIPF